METIAARILSAVLAAIKQQQHEAAVAALQDAEEMGGPEGDDYVALMEAVRDAAAHAGMQPLAADAATRIVAYKESDGYRQALQRVQTPIGPRELAANFLTNKAALIREGFELTATAMTPQGGVALFLNPTTLQKAEIRSAEGNAITYLNEQVNTFALDQCRQRLSR